MVGTNQDRTHPKIAVHSLPGLKTQPNERRCHSTKVKHVLPLPQCCPVTGNPQEGSKIEIHYRPAQHLIEVISLREYVDSYRGGRGDVRSMEGMIQQIAQDCSECIGVTVDVEVELILEPNQKMNVRCVAQFGGK